MRSAILSTPFLVHSALILDDDSSPFINKSLQQHLPLSAPIDTLHHRLESLVESDRVAIIVKRYAQFDSSGDGWDGIVELPRILEISVSPYYT